MNDWTLLRQFCENGSEGAFAQLLKAHLPLVYSVALRQTRGDVGLAEEIVQLTFCVLARKAGSISCDTILPAWLCRTAFYTAQKAIRSEQRRRLREHQAAIMQHSSHTHEEETIWTDIAPHVDEVINLLPEKERGAIILRFFELKPMRELAASLGITEEAARMRISRSLEKLRILLAKRGVALTSIALASLLTEKSLAAVPATLFENLRRGLLRPGNESMRLSSSSGRPTSSLEIAKTIAIIGLVGAVITSVAVYQHHQRSREGSTGTAAAATSAEALKGNGQLEEPFDLNEAVDHLRRALRDPWPSRKPPYERVDQALARYGRFRRKAIPVLMEMFVGLRSSHTEKSMRLGAHGLMSFGPQAEETLRDLIVLHDSGDLMWLEESVVDLFAAIDPTGNTIPKLIDKLREPQGKNYTDLILVTLIKNNPGSELIHRDQLCGLLTDANPDTRAHAAFVIAGIPGLNEAAALTNILGALRLGELHHDEVAISARKSYEDQIIQNQPDVNVSMRLGGYGFQSSQAKQWRLMAIDALRQLGAPESLGPLSEIVHSSAVDSETRNAALAAIAEIDPISQSESPEVNRWVFAHEQGLTLATKARSGQATFEDLLEGLKHQESVARAAEALSENKAQVAAALPAVLGAIENFKNREAIALLQQVDPALLVDQLRKGRTEGMTEIAVILEYIHPPMREAVPYLDEILDHIDQQKNDVGNTFWAVQAAAQKIDPSHSDLFFEPFFSEELRENINDTARATGKTDAALEALQYLAKRPYARVTRIREIIGALSADPIFYKSLTSNQMLQPYFKRLGLDSVTVESPQDR